MARIRSRGPALAWRGGGRAEGGRGPREPVSQLGFGQRAVLPLPPGDRLPSRLELEPVRRRLRQPCAEGGPFRLGGLLDGPGQVGGQRYRALLTLSHDTMVAQQVRHTRSFLRLAVVLLRFVVFPPVCS